jgi:hypothetical protein
MRRCVIEIWSKHNGHGCQQHGRFGAHSVGGPCRQRGCPQQRLTPSIVENHELIFRQVFVATPHSPIKFFVGYPEIRADLQKLIILSHRSLISARGLAIKVKLAVQFRYKTHTLGLMRPKTENAAFIKASANVGFHRK